MQAAAKANSNPVRTAVRFPIALSFCMHTASGDLDAVTENISANGILFSSAVLPEVGSQIEFTMVMPSAVLGSQKDVSIHCMGRIVRHQTVGLARQAAAVIDEYYLRA